MGQDRYVFDFLHVEGLSDKSHKEKVTVNNNCYLMNMY